ncbi:hypothetical protein Sjap_017236 [Stephania japonica]|uniref:LOB domain-containing protein n=1 Tax=Stephania japonica TaxID=461633 RepID=A0AAP0I5S6_9MAGN
MSLPTCAVCKHNMRMCGVGCPYAPYFPAEALEDYRACIAVYSEGFVHTVIMDTPLNQRHAAVENLKWEARFRSLRNIRGGGFGSCIAYLSNEVIRTRNQLVRAAEDLRYAAVFLRQASNAMFLQYQSHLEFIRPVEHPPQQHQQQQQRQQPVPVPRAVRAPVQSTEAFRVLAQQMRQQLHQSTGAPQPPATAAPPPAPPQP